MKAMWKKITSLLLALVMIASMCPLAAFAAEGEDGAAAPETIPAAETVPMEEAAPAEEPAPEEEPAPAEESVSAEETAPAEEMAPVEETTAPETKEEPEELVGPAADGGEGLVVGPVYEPVALPIALDGDAGTQVTVNYYDNAGNRIGSETVNAGGAPAAAVGPYVTVGEKQQLILGFWNAKAMTLNDLPSGGKLTMPMFKGVTANTDYYAVYAPETQGVAYIAYYLSLGEGRFSPIHWGGITVEGEGSKPAANSVPNYMAYQVKDSEGNYYNLYLSISWYTESDLSGEAVDPSERAIRGNTVYYGVINQSFYSVTFYDADGGLLALFPIEEGKTIDAYPGDTEMPSGDYWQDEAGNVYTAAEIQALAITESLTLTPFKGYTVNYYESENNTLVHTETVLPGQSPAEVPVKEVDEGITPYHNRVANNYPYIWYATDAEADDMGQNGVKGTPVDPAQQTITADTNFYGARDFCYVYQYGVDGTRINSNWGYAGKKIMELPPADGANTYTARWTLEDGTPIDLSTYILTGEDLKMHAVGGVKVTYYYGDKVICGEFVPTGEKPMLVPENTDSLIGDECFPILQWTDKDGNVVDPATVTITEDTSFYAAIGHTVTYLDADGETVLGTEQVLSGAAPTQAPEKNGSDKAITNWLNASGGFVVLGSLKITADTTLTAWYSPGLVSDEHGAYISGYGGGIFSPNSDLSRAEAAKIIYSLVESPNKGPFSASFSDMASHWSNEAVTFLASHKIITGYSDGTFLPNLGITRAEFVTILGRLFPMEAGSCDFTDVPEGIWYYNAVASAVEQGWVNGYLESDGSYTFRPNNVITRAEAVTIMNRVLGRSADQAAFDATERMIYRDVAPSHWAFYQIMEASVAHDHSSTDKGETWGDFTLPTTGIKSGLRNPDNVNLYYVDEKGLILRLDAGLNTLPNGNTYYAPKDGCYIPLYDRGVHDLGGKLYYVQKNGAVRTQRYMDGYITPVYEYEGNMYYVKEDFSLARDEWIGNLYFGTDGAYTTKDEELDALVYDFCRSVLLDANQTQSEKLRSMYVYVRDCKLFGYRNLLLNPTISGWSLNDCAKRMLKTCKGECFHWASMMVMIMRRLGFDAYKQNGDVIGSDGGRAPHAWEVINWPDGEKYMFDIQLEWGWLWGFYATGRTFNLYKMDYSKYQSIGTYDW